MDEWLSTWEKRSFQRERQIEFSVELTVDFTLEVNWNMPLTTSHMSLVKLYIQE